MENTINPYALSELIEYLKGIRQEDIERIPKRLMDFFEENASKEYKCNFDCNQPLNQLELLDETRGLISMICYNYWCITDDQKKKYWNKLNENEKKYQNELKIKYDTSVFKEKRKTVDNNENLNMISTRKTGIIRRIVNKIKTLLKLT